MSRMTLHHKMKLRKLKIKIAWRNDWAFAGPLIEKYGINLEFNGKHWFSHYADSEFYASCHHIGEAYGFAPCECRAETPLGTLEKTMKMIEEDESIDV